jgi:hypothetical protein
MRNEWYLCQFKDGKFIGSSPFALSRTEADNLKTFADMTQKGCTWTVKHKTELPKLS